MSIELTEPDLSTSTEEDVIVLDTPPYLKGVKTSLGDIQKTVHGLEQELENVQQDDDTRSVNSQVFRHDKWKYNFYGQMGVSVCSLGVGTALMFTGNLPVGLTLVSSTVSFWLGKSTDSNKKD